MNGGILMIILGKWKKCLQYIQAYIYKCVSGSHLEKIVMVGQIHFFFSKFYIEFMELVSVLCHLSVYLRNV